MRPCTSKPSLSDSFAPVNSTNQIFIPKYHKQDGLSRGMPQYRVGIKTDLMNGLGAFPKVLSKCIYMVARVIWRHGSVYSKAKKKGRSGGIAQLLLLAM